AARPQSGGACPVCRSVTAPNTPWPWALGRDGLAHFGSGAAACPLSRRAGWVGPSGSTRPHPESLTPSRDGLTPARSGDLATFFSRVVWSRARDPVFGPLPIGLKPLESPADAFITPQARGHAVRIAYLS